VPGRTVVLGKGKATTTSSSGSWHWFVLAAILLRILSALAKGN
jgi:hypothetical protein